MNGRNRPKADGRDQRHFITIFLCVEGRKINKPQRPMGADWIDRDLVQSLYIKAGGIVLPVGRAALNAISKHLTAADVAAAGALRPILRAFGLVPTYCVNKAANV